MLLFFVLPLLCLQCFPSSVLDDGGTCLGRMHAAHLQLSSDIATPTVVTPTFAISAFASPVSKTSWYFKVDDATPATALVLQALVEQPPVHPNDVLREIVELAQLPTSEAVYEDEEAQFDDQAGLEEDADLVDVELEGGPEADMSYGQQNFQPPQERSQADMAGGGAGWSDDSFTDAALDDEAFEASGFDVVDQQP